MVWKSTGCPTFGDMWASSILDYNGWSNWEFTLRNLYEPLFKGSSKVYLFGVFNLVVDGEVLMYQLGGEDGKYYSIFPIETYEGRRRDFPDYAFQELMPFIKSHFDLEDGYLVAKRSFFEAKNEEKFIKLLAGSKNCGFSTQLVFDLNISDVETWKHPFENYLAVPGNPFKDYLRATKNYTFLSSKLEEIAKNGNIGLFYRPAQKEFFIVYKPRFGEIFSNFNYYKGLSEKEFEGYLNDNFTDGYEKLLEEQDRILSSR